MSESNASFEQKYEGQTGAASHSNYLLSVIVKELSTISSGETSMFKSTAYTADLYCGEYTSDEDDDDYPEVQIIQEPVVVAIQHNVEIAGIKLQMPVKPYPCQRMVMQALIEGCNTGQNCLIESPTGSGKTLALLCGSLGWAEDYKKKMAVIEEEKREREYEASLNPSPEKCCGNTKDANLTDDDLLEFGEEDWADDAFTNYLPSSTQVPKVFYCSRTHKQLDQVVGELRRTNYGHTIKSTVLSSREFTCIQDSNVNKTKLCAELLDPVKKIGCKYYTDDNKATLGSFNGLRNCGVNGPWDIEDMINLGKAKGCCPYFAARNLMPEANLILCPYNYILDKNIRESMQINLTGSIVILDEAHNIEDFCRDCGSLSLTVKQLETIIENCNGLMNLGIKKKYKNCDFKYANTIQHYCTNLSGFIFNIEMKKESLEAFSVIRWTGPEFIRTLQKNPSLTPEATAVFITAVRDANGAKFGGKDPPWSTEEPTPALDGDNVRILDKLAWALGTIGSEKHGNDYRMFVKQSYGHNSELSLEFLCMNPSVIFSPFCQMARSVILASGTLAPMSSYQGELGVKFPYVIQADHVTPPEQVFIKCVETNSEGNPLRATYSTVNTTEFQDDIGRIILTACSSVPHGILVFVSSYNVMEKLCTRWQKNNMWNRFASMKEIFQETRGSGDITTLMETYRDAIRRTSEKRSGMITGALLFAVYRGKIAEGIDFSDNEARCVLTIGIPYAVRQHPAVDLKCRYNDLNRNKGLLSGSEWYTVNAFKGLNQALGRAIRHQNDWAAIIMVDARIVEPRHSNLLPKWVKSMWFLAKERETDLRALLNRFVASQIRRTASREQKMPIEQKVPIQQKVPIMRKCDML